MITLHLDVKVNLHRLHRRVAARIVVSMRTREGHKGIGNSLGQRVLAEFATNT